MANEIDPHDRELFGKNTAVSAPELSGSASESEPSLTPDSGLPVVGVESSERPAPTVPDATPPSDVQPVFAPLPFEQRYSVRRVLGRGGMGEVRLCRDHSVGRDVAMKVIRPRQGGSSPKTQRRFVREARVQGQLEHPAIVPVYDVGLDPDGALYFTMKRVRGASLAQVMEGLRAGDAALTQRYSRRRLLTLFSQLCMAVHFSHQKGVVHRDLKPANIMLGDFGEVYLLDWGLAGLRDDPAAETSERIDEGQTPHTLATGVLGTPGYMSPEQVTAPGSVDSRADVYALGAILFELLTLEQLHADESPAAVLATTLEVDGASPAARGADVPPELDRLCREATRRDPALRLGSAQQLSSRIEAYLDGDRDLALRRELARAHAERAQEALAESRGEGADEAPARAQAMREVSAALGLHPEHEGAQQTLVRLITEPPRAVPPEAAFAIEQDKKQVYRLSARTALLFYFGYLLYLPLMFWMGIRDWTLFALGWSTIAACAAATYYVIRFPPQHVEVPLVHLIVSTITVGCVSVMFGTFVLLPMLALGNCVVYISAVGQLRGIVPLAGILAVIVPQTLRWLGIIPDNYVFEDGTWTILPSVFYMRPIPTQVFLLTGIVGTLLPTCLFVGKLRQAYAEAQQKLQLQAWQLRQIVPAE